MKQTISSLTQWQGHRFWRIALTPWDAPLFHALWLHWRQSPESDRPNRLHFMAWVENAQLFRASLAPLLQTLDNDFTNQLWGLIPGLHRFRFEDHALQLSLCIGPLEQYRDYLQSHPSGGWVSPIDVAQSVCVIGSGIAGASAARALAERGYRVSVLDAGANPAAGASGLPVGLVAPHASPDDAPLSRLSRAGVRAMHQTMTRFLQPHQDWNPTGVLEHRLPGKTRKGGTPLAWRQAWSEEAQDWTSSAPSQDTSLWHAKAAWVKPRSLVTQLLSHPQINWQGQTALTHLAYEDHQWCAYADDACISRSDQLIVAAGPHSAALLRTATPDVPPIQPIRGQLSWGLMHDIDPAAWPPTPTNGHGSFIAHVPTPHGLAWYSGSTFDRHHAEPIFLAPDHQENWQRLHALLPQTAQALAPLFEAPQDPASDPPLQAWVQVRATVPDRLPLVGKVPHAPPGLWMISALGSRGLSLGVLCGELLACQWSGEPPPLEPALASLLRAQRFAEKRLISDSGA